MVRHRSAFFGLALSLAVLGTTACEDKTDIVIPDPPAPALQISVTPAAITIEEGESGQMVAQVTGGATGGDKSVTWTSSNTSVATVSANGNVVTVSGVARGTSTIRATAVADPNVSAAAVVTVEAVGGGVPPSISIKSITTGATNVPVNINNVAGQIEITLNLEVPVGTFVDRVEILANNQVIYTQSFTGVDLGLAVDEAQNAVDLVASWNTAEFDRTQLGIVGTVQGNYPNGTTTVTAQVVGGQGTITATTSTNIVLNNVPFIYSRLNYPTGAGMAINVATGLAWYTGDIHVTAMGVKYNNDPANDIASVTLTNTGSDPEVVTDNTPADGFQLVLQKSGGSALSRIELLETGAPATPLGVVLSLASVTAGGAGGPACVVTENTPVPLNLGCVGAVPANQMPLATPLNWDNVAPAITLFDLTPATLGCAPALACYISGNPATPAFIFAARAGFFTHVDAGVGSPTVTFMAGEPGSLIPVATGEDLPETVVPSFIASATTCDALQNCRTQFASTAGVGQNSATGAQLVGVDSTDPTATVDNVTPNMSTNIALNPAWTISFSDAGVGPSGFSALPVSVQLKKTTPAGSTCYIPQSPVDPTAAGQVACTTSSGAINYQVDDGVIDVDLTLVPGTSEGYWELTAFVRDQATNFSKPSVERITLNDVTPPVIGGIAGPSSLPGGANVTFSAGLADNVDLGWIEPFLTYGAGPVFQYPDVTLGAYGVADGLVSTTTGNFTIGGFVRSVEANLATGRSGGVVNEASRVDFNVFDIATNTANAFVNITPAVQFAAGGAIPALSVIAPTIFAPADVAHGNFIHQAPSAPQVCQGTAAACGATPPASTVLSATMTGPNATFANPFIRVEFYYQDPVNLRWYLIGVGAASASDNTVTTTRTWTYSNTWTVTGLTASDGAALHNGHLSWPLGGLPLVAVGVHSTGSAIISTGTPQTIDITAT
ncbi:MAG TPA: Ig-like domain-containing protein [Longimicrobiales bacterium]|nr:Ig-like domain-containing protein [Longimicrobiales bacterium]